MCGIAGFVNMDGAPADAGVLEAMTDMIRHRGPDDRGTLCLSLRGGIPDTALGFHRLKILDLSAHAHIMSVSCWWLLQASNRQQIADLASADARGRSFPTD